MVQYFYPLLSARSLQNQVLILYSMQEPWRRISRPNGLFYRMPGISYPTAWTTYTVYGVNCFMMELGAPTFFSSTFSPPDHGWHWPIRKSSLSIRPHSKGTSMPSHNYPLYSWSNHRHLLRDLSALCVKRYDVHLLKPSGIFSSSSENLTNRKRDLIIC
jgi:hypothetical protein